MKKTFQYKAHIQSIPAIRKDLDELRDKWNMPPSEMRQILLIIEELFSNIIRYACRERTDHQAYIDIQYDASVIDIQIKDDGLVFNPLDFDPEISNDPLRHDEGGMGLALVKTFADQISYVREGQYNKLIIRKHVKSIRES